MFRRVFDLEQSKPLETEPMSILLVIAEGLRIKSQMSELNVELCSKLHTAKLIFASMNLIFAMNPVYLNHPTLTLSEFQMFVKPLPTIHPLHLIELSML